MQYASIGSISEGTLRADDLLSTFASVLASHVKRNFANLDSKAIYDYAITIDAAEAIGGIDSEDCEDEHKSDVIQELELALEQFAPPYCYFGSAEGDGACFGFFPSMDSVHDLPRVNDSDEAKALGEDCVFVNDHGNVTVFGGDGSVIWDCV